MIETNSTLEKYSSNKVFTMIAQEYQTFKITNENLN